MSRSGRYAWRNLLRGGSAGLLIVAAFFGVLAYGGTLAWGYAGLEILAAMSGILWVLAWTVDERPSAWLALLPAAPLLLCCAQLAPAPERLIQTLSPDTHAAQQECREQFGLAPRSCLSVYPEATWRAGIQIALFAFVGVATIFLARRQFVARALAIALAGLGLLEWALGLCLPRVAGRAIYGNWHRMLDPYTHWHPSGRWPPLHTAGTSRTMPRSVGGISYLGIKSELGDVFGSFVVSNHFAGCLELCLPFAFALCLVAASRSSDWRWSGLWIFAVVALAGGATWTVHAPAQSRAGAAALLLAMLVVGCVGSRQSRWRRVWLGLTVAFLLLVVGFLIVAANRWDVAISRFGMPEGMRGSFIFAAYSVHGRMDWWDVCWRMFCKSPLFGVGWGGFDALAPQYSPYRNQGVHFAHNDYAQLIAETGLAGIGMLTMTGCVLWRVLFRAKAIQQAIEPARETWSSRVIAIGSSGALAGFALHSLLDWNLHVPANALLATIVFGLWLSMRAGAAPENATAATAADSSGPDRPWSTIALRLAQSVAVVMLTLAAASAGRNLLAERPLDALRECLEHFWVPDDDRAATLQRLPALMPPAKVAALGAGEWNAEYAKLIGLADLHLSGGHASPQLIDAEAWLATAQQRCPADRKLRVTLDEIRARLNRVAKPAATSDEVPGDEAR